jgi:alpha-glucosidase
MVKFSVLPGGFEARVGGLSVLRHAPDFPFVSLGRGRERIDMYRGNFDIQDEIDERIELRDCEAWLEAGVLTARLSRGGLYPLVCRLSERDGLLSVSFGPLPEGVNRAWLHLPAEVDERVYGCGEQFSHFNLRGRRFPLWTSEQGVGRNKATEITFRADVADKAGGDYWWTFFPQPTFVSGRRYFCHADTSLYAAYDFRAEDRHELHYWGLPKELVFGAAPSMLGVVSALSALLGRQPELPDWVYDGVILGIQGGTGTCLRKLEAARARGVPVCGIWAQDWEGIRMTSFGKRLMWDWQWDSALYPGLDRTIAELKAEGVRFLGYINPYVAAGKPLFAEASSKGYLARNAAGDDYLVDFGEFDAGIVDFTNPAAAAWYKGVIKKNLIDFGLSGWMADFGEYLPHDVSLHDGTSGMEAHNAWPAFWARINREAVEEAGRLGDILYFMRAGFTGSQKECPLLWAGDQNVDWSVDDGLPSVIPAALSAAVCGCGLHHSDIGGYTTLFGMKRTKELHQRWAELAAFTVLMRGHEGNRPGDNWQFDSDEETLDHLARMGRVHAALKPYLQDAAALNAREGVPVQRPLFLHYENEPDLWDIQDEYLLGRDLLVAPVLEPGAVSRSVRLPDDRWKHLWTGREYGGGTFGIEAPIGQPPVFYRPASSFAPLFASFQSSR